MRIRMSELRALIREAAYTVAEFDGSKFDQVLDEVDRLVTSYDEEEGRARLRSQDRWEVIFSAVAKFYNDEYAEQVAQFIDDEYGYEPIKSHELRGAVEWAMSEIDYID